MQAEISSPPVRPAATLILVRQHAGGLQAYLLRRSAASGFMAGRFVFPGGWVDDGDRDDAFWAGHVDLSVGGIDARLGRGLARSAALGFAVAAVREAFEEAGVLFASRAQTAGGCLPGEGVPRPALGLPQGWLRRRAEAEGWALQLSALSPYAHWITPVGMPRRFDTRFFVAEPPAGQDCSPDRRETVEGLWVSPRRALEENLAGRLPLSPPTLVTLHELLACAGLDDLRRSLAGRGWGEPILPRMIHLGAGGGFLIIEPWDPWYGDEDLRLDPGALGQSVLPVGQPFSRLWHRDGVFRPVAASPC
jgi:8-oxo-dGTP pyrophosphatase MutT (NUDIX family)